MEFHEPIIIKDNKVYKKKKNIDLSLKKTVNSYKITLKKKIKEINKIMKLKNKEKKAKKSCSNLNLTSFIIMKLIIKLIIILTFIIIFAFTFKTYNQDLKKLRKYLDLYNKTNYDLEKDSLIKITKEVGNNIKKEYEKMKQRPKSNIIISFTSYPRRFKNLPLMIYSLVKNTISPFKIIMVLTEEDEKNLTPLLKIIINNGIVEVLRAKENLKPHNKYYYTMINIRKIQLHFR